MYIPKHNAFFIHVPKTGGNSIEFYFLKEMGINVSIGNSNSVFNNNKKLIIGTQKGYQSAHYTAEQLKSIEEFNKSNFVFSIVRHPFDRFISEFAWRQQHRSIKLNKLLENLEEQNDARLYSCWDYLTIDNKLVVDRIFKLENTEEINTTLSKQFNIDFKMPWHNPSKKDKHILTDKEKEIIMKVWRKDFEEFNYENDK